MRVSALAGVVLLVFGVAACDDPNAGLFDPIIQEDTVDLAVPLASPEVPTALDVAYASSMVRGRHPELIADAEQWDLALRQGGDDLLFAPAGVFGFQNPVGGASRAAVTLPMERGIDEVIEAPGDASFRSDTMVAIRTDRVYVVRSRRTGASISGCENYAKVQPLNVDPAAGLVRLRVIGNARCNDPRLAESD